MLGYVFVRIAFGVISHGLFGYKLHNQVARGNETHESFGVLPWLVHRHTPELCLCVSGIPSYCIRLEEGLFI